MKQSQLMNEHNSNLNTFLKPLQPEQTQIDYYNKKGKISRSYSENDYHNYFQQAQNILPPMISTNQPHFIPMSNIP